MRTIGPLTFVQSHAYSDADQEMSLWDTNEVQIQALSRLLHHLIWLKTAVLQKKYIESDQRGLWPTGCALTHNGSCPCAHAPNIGRGVCPYVSDDCKHDVSSVLEQNFEHSICST